MTAVPGEYIISKILNFKTGADTELCAFLPRCME